MQYCEAFLTFAYNASLISWRGKHMCRTTSHESFPVDLQNTAKTPRTQQIHKAIYKKVTCWKCETVGYVKHTFPNVVV